MHDLPRQLSVEELAELFEGRTRLVERLASYDDPLEAAPEVIAGLSEEEKLEALDAHPAIGAGNLSARSAAEQGAEADPAVLEELADLNRAYEERFGFRFVVFVNGRPKSEILEVLRVRIERTRDEELDTGLDRARRHRPRPQEPRLMDPYANEWLDFLARWLHVVAGIAWIGTSFYFVAVDNHLRSPEDPADARRGVAGEEWEIHGGGFYQVQKYRVAPPKLPDPLYWFKWEAYTTWLSGFALLIVLYYVNAGTYLVDKSVADLTSTEAILISIGLLVVAWVVYDALCRAIPSQLVLAVAVIALTTVAAWGCSQLFSGRAAYVQVGAMLGTIMAANVFIVIIPAHHKLLRAMKEGREPDPAPGIRAKERSVHNNYLTLPVLFAMLSPHFPSTYGHSYSWLILVVMMLIGAWIRLYFNLRHVGYNAWPILVTAALGDRGRRDRDPAAGELGRRCCGRRRSRCVHAGAVDRRGALRSLPLVEPDAGWTRRRSGSRSTRPSRSRRRPTRSSRWPSSRP